MTKEEKAFLEYWFEKKHQLFHRQNNGTKAFNAKKEICFRELTNNRVACLQSSFISKLTSSPSVGERYGLEDLSTEFEILAKLDDKFTYEIKVDEELLSIECDVYSIKYTR